VRLSEQELVSCTQPYGNYGCRGGHDDYCWEYAQQHGIVADSEYPYVSGETLEPGSCDRSDSMTPIATVTEMSYRINGGAYPLMEHLKQGPVSLSIFTRTEVFWQYKSGIVTAEDCSFPGYSTHTVVLVGFDPGSEATGPVYETVTTTETKCRMRRRDDLIAESGCRAEDWYVHEEHTRFCCHDSEVEEQVLVSEGEPAKAPYWLI